MPADPAAALSAVAFVFAGAGVLAAVGWHTHGPLRTIGVIVLAYVAGLAATMLVAIALLCAGIPMHISVFAVVSVLVGTGGIGIRAWRERARWRLARLLLRTGLRMQSPGTWTVERWLAGAVGVILLAYVVLGYGWAKTMPLNAWDAWSIWARKGTILLDYGTLPTAFFGSHSYAFMHPDYPLLVPTLESIWFRLVGGADTQSLHVQFWLLFVTSVGAAAYLAARVTPVAIWAPLIGFIAVLPAATSQLMTLYADIPMALFLMLGVLLLGLWIEDHRGSLLSLAALFLAAAANTKNEGLTAAVCALVVAFLITAARPVPRRRNADLRALVIACAAFAAAVAPWRLWLAVHHIGGDMPVGKGLDPSYLASRSGRISPTLTALYAQISDQGVWHYLLPLGVSAVLACLIVRETRRLAAFYALTGVGILATVLWGYTINPNRIGWLAATSATRTVDGLMFVAIAALLHLTGATLAVKPQAQRATPAVRDGPRRADVPPKTEAGLQALSDNQQELPVASQDPGRRAEG